jgi:hypothetical protein
VRAYLVAECVSISVDYRAPRCGSEILTDSATVGTYSDSCPDKQDRETPVKDRRSPQRRPFTVDGPDSCLRLSPVGELQLNRKSTAPRASADSWFRAWCDGKRTKRKVRVSI